MSDLVTSLKALGAKMTGQDIAGKDLVSVMRDFGTNLTGENIIGNDLVQVIDGITENYTGGGDGGDTMYHFWLGAQTGVTFSNVYFIGDSDYRSDADGIPADVFYVRYDTLDMYGVEANFPLGETGFVVEAKAQFLKIQLESNEDHSHSDDILYLKTSGSTADRFIFVVDYSDIKAAIDAFEAQGKTVYQINIKLQNS